MKWTTTGGDFLPAPIDSFNYDGKLNNAWFTFDVTQAVNTMVKNPETNFGFIIKITSHADSTKTIYHENYFHSSEAADASLTPRLVVAGVLESAVKTLPGKRRHLQIRKLHNAVSVYFPGKTPYSLFVTDYQGRTLYRSSFDGKTDRVRIPWGFARGVYCITVRSGGMRQARKVMVF